MVTVPDCEGVALTTLRTRLVDLGITPEEDTETSDEIDEGDVIRCEPASGQEIPEGSTLLVFVSSGQEEVQVPSLRGQTQSQAEATLREFDLTVGEVSFEPDPEVPDGSVIRSDPPSGNTVAAGSQVEPRHQQRPDAVADALAHAGPDAGADAGPDAGAHAGPDANAAADSHTGALARGTAGARMTAIPFPRLGGTFNPP